jgi:hypothetical protein
LRRLFGRPRERGGLVGDGDFAFHIISTSFHQATLKYLYRKRTPEGALHYCAALLTPQPNNPHDRKAVAVIIRDLEVGYLDRDVAPDFLRALYKAGFADAACETLIVGGWDRGGHDWGPFSIRVNANMPFIIHPAAEWHGKSAASSKTALPTFLQHPPP